MLGSACRRLTRAVVVVTLATVAAGVASWGALAAADGSGQPADTGLISRLAVLQRAQTPTDVLPPGVNVIGAHGTLIPGLTRLVASLPGVSVYLAVSTPAGGSPPVWSPRLGDQVGIVEISGGRAVESVPVPAVGLDDGFAVSTVVAAGAESVAYNVGIVPDGVARVRWTFANATETRTYVTDALAGNNIAIAPVHVGTPFVLRATWFAPDGSVIPTSDAALRRALAARDEVLRERVVRLDARSSYRPSPAILAEFAVFDVTSRTGVRVGDLTISQPRLSSVPLPILRLTRSGRRLQLDPEDMRQATTPQGVSAWITPGRKGICVAVVDRPQFPFRYGGGGGMGCSGSVALAERYGAGLSVCCHSGYGWNYGVLPDGHPTITIRIGARTRETIEPPDGVYIYRNYRRSRSSR